MKKGFVLSIILTVLVCLTYLSGCQTANDNLTVPEPSSSAETVSVPVSEPEVIPGPESLPEPEPVSDVTTEEEQAYESSFEEGPDAENETQSDVETEPEDETEPETEESGEDTLLQEPEDEYLEEVPHELSYSDDIDTIIASMTLHEKICQMIIVTPSVLTGQAKVTSADSMYTVLQDYPVGGMIFDKSNIINSAQLSGMISGAQSCMTIPMIMTLDEEGGRVTRLMGTVGTTQIGPMYSYHELGPETAAFNAMTIGNDIRRFGFNMDLAPVADVWSNPANTVIGDRAYSTDFDEAATLVSAAVSGFHMSGVACCIKHFPGHGDTSADSHYGSVYVYKTLDEIRANEFKPFISGIGAGADAVMVGHLIVADQGNVPALFSYPLLTGVLRNELGFNGVIMSDSLQMKAMTDYYGAGDIPVMAVAAGCDVLLMPTDLEITVSSLENAVLSGVISEERINQSVRRILILKKKYI